MRIGIVAGEASGDILGSGLIASLTKLTPELHVEGIAGPLMQAQGATSLFPMEKLSVMGIAEVLSRYRELSAIRRSLIRHFIKNPPDVFIGIDAPDFNLYLEKKLREHGIKTVHYVSPSVWAWRENRLKKIEKAVDLMLTLFPFEQQYYQDHRIQAEFVGHPLADEVPLEIDQEKYLQHFNLNQGNTTIAILPGSRKNELLQLSEPFIQAATLLYSKNKHLNFIAPMANHTCREIFENTLQKFNSGLPVKIVNNQSREAMAAADIILLASGTAALEAMLLKKPMVVAYRFAKISYWIIKKRVKVNKYSLPNLLSKNSLVPELIQQDVRPESIAEEINSYLHDQQKVQLLRQTFKEIHLTLKQNASEQAARHVMKLAGKNVT